MGLGLDFFGSSSGAGKEYSEVLIGGSPAKSSSEHEVCRASIERNSDVLKAEDKLHEGDIVIADLADLERGMTKDRVVSSLQETIEQLNGDIAFLDEDDRFLIITPSSTSVCKDEI